MSSQDETSAVCKCQYILCIGAQETRGSVNDIPNIHEIDEEESETEETTALERPDPSDEEGGEKAVQKARNASNDESAYTGESFCSDDEQSCDESEITSGSLNSSSLIHITDLQLSESSKEQDIEASGSEWRDDDRQDDSYSLSDDTDEPSCTATADRSAGQARRTYKRCNMSFTDEEMRKIERENELLLRKIMAQQKPRHRILGEGSAQSRTSSSAINRKKLQKKIENDNMLLLRRIQKAKSCVFTDTSKMGCRLTFL